MDLHWLKQSFFFLQERVARLKREGKFLTPAQKEQKRKAEAMLAAMREQGTTML